MKTRKESRVSDRWAFRVPAKAAVLVRRAAESADRTLTEFVVDAAVLEAERVLADRTQFVLPPAQWKQFVELLDRPAKTAGLSNLFARASVFESE